MSIPLTVALLTYNRSHYLKESLSAILNQTYRNFELLVLDNGSSDDTPQVVLGYQDERIRYVRNPPGYTARFNGLSAVLIARGERLVITHDDDVMEPDMLERQMNLLAARPDLTAVWTGHCLINEKGEYLTAPPTADEDIIYARGEYIVRLSEDNLWHPPSCLMFTPHLLSYTNLRRHYLDLPTLRKRQEITGSGDHIMPMTMNLKGSVAFINAPLLRYRKHSGQESEHVHLVSSVLHRFQILRRFIRKTNFQAEHVPLLDAQIARYKAQKLVIHQKRQVYGRETLRRLKSLLAKAVPKTSDNPRARYRLLPLAILLMQCDIDGDLDEPAIELLDGLILPTAQEARSIHQLYQWARYRQAGINIFPESMVGESIAIFGSAFISSILILEARAMGISVVCCLDSNVTRQGSTLLGIPIVPHSWLASHPSEVSVIIHSAERDHEQELEVLIRKHDVTTLILSWKDLVGAATDPHWQIEDWQYQNHEAVACMVE